MPGRNEGEIIPIQFTFRALRPGITKRTQVILEFIVVSQYS